MTGDGEWWRRKLNSMPVPPPASDFAATRDYLFSLKAGGPRFGIERMARFAAELGHPERAVPCIHIAGTNGKGSVAALLESMLRAAGHRVGLYTSPHLVHVGERVQVDRRPLSDRQIVEYVRELRPVADRIARGTPDLAPTFFEYLTAMAWLEFGRSGCAIAVLETGLGGRLDATNIVTPLVTAITSIGLDHAEYLGDTIERIATEKAGIIKPRIPVVVGRMPAAAESVIRARAAELGAGVSAVSATFAGEGGTARPLPVTQLEGEYQRWNAATATLVAEQLPARFRVDARAVAAGLAQARWPGRWETRRLGGRTLVLDASHNPEGAETLAENLAALERKLGRKPVVLTAVLGAERAKPLLDVISRHATEIHLTTVPDPRACAVAELARLVPTSFAGRLSMTRIEEAFPAPGTCTLGAPDGVVVVTGSIYLLGEVLRRLGVPAASAAPESQNPKPGPRNS